MCHLVLSCQLPVCLQAGIVTTEIPLNPELNRTGDVWHIMLPGLKPGLLYGKLVA
jgi:pullulanase/glycogen debranching enzyme